MNCRLGERRKERVIVSFKSLLLIAALAFAACNSNVSATEDSNVKQPDRVAQPAVGQPAGDSVASAAATAQPAADVSPAAHHKETVVAAPTIDPVSASPDLGNSSATADNPSKRAVREITIPAGTMLRVQLGSQVSSAASRVEDPVHATVQRAVVVNGVSVVPAGAAVSGYVTEATRSGRVKGRARVGLRFTSLRVGGSRYSIRTAPVARVAPATKKADAEKIAVGAGAGAIVGAIAGGKKGAAIGTAVGGGSATGAVLATRGKEVALPRGSVITARLASPVTVRVH